MPERGRHYRGLIEATAGGGPLRLVNQLDVETYLKGMGEVPSNWPIEAIAAQTVAARTYALRAMSFSGELCDYDLCQVYVGADREAAGQNEAVDATRGQVLSYGGSLATAVYSADAGGITATPLEGFGSATTYPYLQVVRYDTPDPLPWRAEVALADVASPPAVSGLGLRREDRTGGAVRPRPASDPRRLSGPGGGRRSEVRSFARAALDAVPAHDHDLGQRRLPRPRSVTAGSRRCPTTRPPSSRPPSRATVRRSAAPTWLPCAIGAAS